MTAETRFIAVSREQAIALEEVGEQLLRIADARASLILAMVLAWRSAPSVRQIPLAEHSIRVDEEHPVNEPGRGLRVLEGGEA